MNPKNQNIMKNECGFLGSFLSNSLKTTQLEVNTDAKTLRPVARLKEPRDLFALPKERDNECPQQAARWPTECQVLDERVYHIEYVPLVPEAYNKPTGNELQPRPVGEENGVVVYSYNPVSAVNYQNNNDDGVEDDDDSYVNKENRLHLTNDDDSSSSTESSRSPSPIRLSSISEETARKILHCKNQNQIKSHSDDESDSEEEDSENEGIDPKVHRCSKTQAKRPLSSDPEPPQHLIKRQNNSSTEIIDDNDENHSVPCLISLPQFSRSSVGGSKYLLNCHPNPPENGDLIFESRFESGNLAKAVKITPTYYELYLRPDMYTNRHTQWFYFRVTNTKKGLTYRFSIVNLVKSDSLYNEGMRPLMYSNAEAKNKVVGWVRCGENISYYKNDDSPPSNDDDTEDNGSYTLTFNITFQYENDTVYFAHSYPYTYTDLQDYLMEIQRNPIKSSFCKLRLLCRSLAGNNVYYLTVTAPSVEEEVQRKKRAVVVSARVHPGETPSSWMMKGFMDFITGDSLVAKKLRHKFIFKLIPMLNPDGVIVGNTRNSLTGKDLNRQYRTVIRETYPSIWYTKAMIKRLMEECGVVMYCDMHAHSRKHNIFIYGCENKRIPEKKLHEQIFPLMLHKNVADKFSFENCKFKVQRNKEGTGRIVVWMLGITNSYTMEASFGGTTMGARAGTHFSTPDFEHLGRAFCETLMDYYDENPIKVNRVKKFLKFLKRIRKRERKARKAAKKAKKLKLEQEYTEKLRSKILQRLENEGSSADEPLNIPLTDYSSDEGDTSASSSENEGGPNSEYEGPCCQPLKVPPSSPVFVPKAQKQPKKVKKTKSKLRRTESQKFTRQTMRQILELPTNEPGCEFLQQVYTGSATEDETEIEDMDSGDYRCHKLMARGDLHRKFSHAACDTVCKMPPELIIKSAKKNDEVFNCKEIAKSDEANSNQNQMSEFPAISNNRRTKSWHSLNRNVTKSNQDVNTAYDQSDSLQLKLSLKKKIWSGTDTYANRPLSWGIPQMIRIPNYDSDALLEACSLKLAALQETTVEIKSTSKFFAPVMLRQQLKSADPVRQRRQSIPKIKSARADVSHQVSEASIAGHSKDRKSKISLNKIVQSTEMITRMTKSTKSEKKLFSSTTVNSSPSAKAFSQSSRTIKPPSKFKTGGNVAIAVQPIKKSKKSRNSNLASVVTKKVAAESETDTDNAKFAKKLRSRVKKKKTLSN